MAGRKQHHIPRLLLRGFKIPNERTEKVWTYWRDKGPTPVSLAGIAAERDFYSAPDILGQSTLDDEITDYEDRLLTLLKAARGAGQGEIVDPNVAAEIVTHLTSRSAHLRSALSEGTKTLALQMFELFQEEGATQGLLGLNGRSPTARFRNLIDERLAELGQFSEVLPRDLLHRLAFVFARENFPQSFEAMRSTLVQPAALLHRKADELVRNTHNKALKGAMVPAERFKQLAAFEWRLLRSRPPLILPDCIAIAYTTPQAVVPFLLADLKDAPAIAMPLDNSSLLVGSRTRWLDDVFDTFNIHAAACSSSFFCSSETSDKLNAFKKFIGVTLTTNLHETIDQSLRDHLRDSPDDNSDVQAPLAFSDIAIRRPQQELFANDHQWKVTFHCWNDEALAQRLADELGTIFSEHASPRLYRLDGMSITPDVSDTAQTIEASSDHPIGATSDRRISTSVPVIRQDVAMIHLVFHTDVALALVSDEKATRRWAIDVVKHELASIECSGWLEDGAPGITFAPFRSAKDGNLHWCLSEMYRRYFAIRSGYATEANGLDLEIQCVSECVEAAGIEIVTARREFHANGDVSAIFAAARLHAASILFHVASALALIESLDESERTSALAKVSASLKEPTMRFWPVWLQKDLRQLWNERGQPQTVQNLTALLIHAERLLWQFGVFMWDKEDGQLWVEVFYPPEPSEPTSIVQVA